MAKRSRYPARNQKVAGSILDGDVYFHFEFFACFPSLVVKDEASNSQAYYQNIVRPDTSGLHSWIIIINYDACSCKRSVSTAFREQS